MQKLGLRRLERVSYNLCSCQDNKIVLNGSKYSSIFNSRSDQLWCKEDYSFVKGGRAQFTCESKKCNSAMHRNYIHIGP